ncbi:MAG: DUF1501 domain-containing protein [Actinomycetota bacterium]
MLDIQLGPKQKLCDGSSRRDFIKVGYCGVVGLSLADLLRIEAAQAAATGARASNQKNVILIWLHGGQTQLETFDMKPDAPSEVRGPFKPIPSNLPGLQVCELLPRMAKVMDRVTIHRGFNHPNNDHYAAAHWLLSGYLGATGGDQRPRFPSMGAVASRVLGARKPGIPPYVIMNDGGFGYHGAAYLGAQHHPIRTGDESYGNEGPQLPIAKTADLQPLAGLNGSRYLRRQTLLQDLDRVRREVDRASAQTQLDQAQQKALDMVVSGKAHEAFDLSKEDAKTREWYGPGWGENALLARRLIEAGSRFVVCNTGYWDDHGNIKGAMESKLPRHDRMVACLIEDLHQRGMLEDTLVVAAGEFGRTSGINKDGGRDHWAQASCLMLAGGGFKHGQVIGATDDKAMYPTDNPIGPADMQATLYHHLGISRELTFEDQTGRPQYLLPPDEGKVIKELL